MNERLQLPDPEEIVISEEEILERAMSGKSRIRRIMKAGLIGSAAGLPATIISPAVGAIVGGSVASGVSRALTMRGRDQAEVELLREYSETNDQ